MLDKEMFPHIFDAIVQAADDDALLALRAASRDVRAAAVAILNAKPLAWTAYGVYRQALLKGPSEPCAVRTTLRNINCDPLPTESQLKLRRPLLRLHRRLLSDFYNPRLAHSGDPSPLGNEIVNIPVLDIWPNPNSPFDNCSIPGTVEVLRLWPGSKACERLKRVWEMQGKPPKGMRGYVKTSFRTLVFLPDLRQGGPRFHNPPVFVNNTSNPRMVVHLAQKKGSPDPKELIDSFELRAGKLGEVVLVIGPRITSPPDDTIPQAIDCMQELRFMADTITLVNFQDPGHAIDFRAVFPMRSWSPPGVQILANVIRAYLVGWSGTARVRYLSLEEYGAEIGQEQFNLEMGL